MIRHILILLSITSCLVAASNGNGNGNGNGRDRENSNVGPRWHNIQNDVSWLEQSSVDFVRRGNKHVTGMRYSEDGDFNITHPVNIMYTITVLDQFSRGDGKGVQVTDATGKRWFISIDDAQGEFLIFNEDRFATVAAAAKPLIRKNIPYDVHITVTKNHISLHVRGDKTNVNLQGRVQITFPIKIDLQCQRSGAIFEDVHITSYLNSNG